AGRTGRAGFRPVSPRSPPGAVPRARSATTDSSSRPASPVLAPFRARHRPAPPSGRLACPAVIPPRRVTAMATLAGARRSTGARRQAAGAAGAMRAMTAYRGVMDRLLAGREYASHLTEADLRSE